MSSCDAWIQFVTPSDVRAIKTRLDPFVASLDGAISECPKVDSATREAWAGFITSWRTFVSSEEHFLTAASEFNMGCEYQSAIARWQRTLGTFACGVPGPSLPEPRASGGDTATMSTLRTLAIAGGVIALALTVRSLAR